ncbi:MAG: helix-turn-helix transcriptional regulator [Deferribacteraceae bacterium]|jgi:phage repressor protein C with HTH and peptisase S24 domain|nr:helix-turn-helix transcriptional regulator [Deferribacteraceae bacterium]
MVDIKKICEVLKITQAEFAGKIGVSTQTLHSWMTGKNEPTGDKLKTISSLFDVSPIWLLTGEGEMLSSDVEKGKLSTDGGGFVYIPRYNVAVAAGGGVATDYEHEIDKLAFQKKWINKQPYPANTLSMVTVTGDSMEPTYKNHDIVMITTEISNLSPAVYVIRNSDGLRLKRLYKDKDGCLHIISDNKVYPEEIYKPEEIEAGNIEIIGKVVWFGRNV